MYPNLMGQMKYFHLTEHKMAEIIGCTRNSFRAKMESGRFTPAECKAICEKFNKPFSYLFATEDEI